MRLCATNSSRPLRFTGATEAPQLPCFDFALSNAPIIPQCALNSASLCSLYQPCTRTIRKSGSSGKLLNPLEQGRR